MHAVGEFVGVHADESRLGFVDESVHVVGDDVGFSDVRERVAKFGKRGGPKLWALADVSFPEEALRLVHAHTECALHGKAVVLSVEALLVQRVSHLVDGAHDGVHEIFLVVAGGDAHVEGSRAAGEGVHGTIETSFVEIETHLGRHRAAEGLLRVLREDAVGERGGCSRGARRGSS